MLGPGPWLNPSRIAYSGVNTWPPGHTSPSSPSCGAHSCCRVWQETLQAGEDDKGFAGRCLRVLVPKLPPTASAPRSHLQPRVQAASVADPRPAKNKHRRQEVLGAAARGVAGERRWGDTESPSPSVSPSSAVQEPKLRQNPHCLENAWKGRNSSPAPRRGPEEL